MVVTKVLKRLFFVEEEGVSHWPTWLFLCLHHFSPFVSSVVALFAFPDQATMVFQLLRQGLSQRDEEHRLPGVPG